MLLSVLVCKLGYVLSICSLCALADACCESVFIVVYVVLDALVRSTCQGLQMKISPYSKIWHIYMILLAESYLLMCIGILLIKVN